MDRIIQMEEDVVRYLEGEMSKEEISIFEKRLESEPELNNLLLEYRGVLNGVEYWGDEQVKATIAKVQKDLEVQDFFNNTNATSGNYFLKSGNQIKSAIKFLVAACILSAVAFSVFIWLTPAKINGVELFSFYNKVDKNQIQKDIEKFNVSGLIAGAQAEDTIKQALIYLAEGNYKASSILLESFNAEKSGIPLVQFYLGLSYLNLEMYDKSESFFKNLCKLNGFELRNDACWYYALQMVRRNQNTEIAKSILLELSSNTSFNKASDAKELLEKLDN
ncbi:MAG: hypothetical protein IPG21_06835 [Saprospiraceae bacterium]|nr:hypothetical protein [Candidatus Vicinibacter affinis]MBK7799552.1 hypothetical protein [Candidatus Vicinibacter affinis]MBP6173742.1 hypothetical protein [Saprospiraceae bacterium]HQX44282.1 hypothetical protein [Saprospiraceae bacterium]